jgi:hypothetical protein
MTDAFGDPLLDGPIDGPALIADDELSSRAWLLGAATISLIASVALLFADDLALHLVGYLAAVVLTFGFVVFFRRHAQKRQLHDGIVLTPGARRAATWLIVAAIAAGAANAYLMAPDLVRALT